MYLDWLKNQIALLSINYGPAYLKLICVIINHYFIIRKTLYIVSRPIRVIFSFNLTIELRENSTGLLVCMSMNRIETNLIFLKNI
jgi:hypothetical protein